MLGWLHGKRNELVVRRPYLVIGLVALALSACGPKPPTALPDRGPSPALAWEREATGLGVDIDLSALDTTADGELVMVLDLVDRATGERLAPLADGIALQIGGHWVPGTYRVQTMAEALLPVALGLLVVDDGHLGEAGVAQAIARAAAALGPDDQVALFVDRGAGLEVVVDWTTGPAALARALVPRAQPGPVATKLLRSTLQAAERFMQADARLPAQRTLVVLSDGHDELTQAQADKRMAAIVDMVATGRVLLETIVVPPGEGGRRVDLRSLAAKTAGRTTTSLRDDELAGALEASVQRMRGRYRVVLHPETSLVGVDPATPFEIACKTSDGRFAKYTVEPVRVVF